MTLWVTGSLDIEIKVEENILGKTTESALHVLSWRCCGTPGRHVSEESVEFEIWQVI